MNNSPTQKQENLIKPGQIFALGEHRLAFGSCADSDLIRRIIGTDKINLGILDPPYACSLVKSKNGFMQKLSKDKDIINDHEQSDQQYAEFTQSWINAMKPYLASKNSVFIFNSDKMIFSLREAILKSGLKFGQLLIWIKNHAPVGRLDYLPMHELIAYCWFGAHKFYKHKDKSVLYCPKPNKSKFHPSTKPSSLIRRLILNNSKIGDVVYDGFGGSGTTLLCAEETKRKCLMVELDEEYVNTTIARWEKLTGQKAKVLNY